MARVNTMTATSAAIESAAEPAPVIDVGEPGEAGSSVEEPSMPHPDSLESAEAKADEAWLEGAIDVLKGKEQDATAAS